MKDNQFFGNPVISDIIKPSFNTRVIYIMGGRTRHSEGALVRRFTGHFRWFECQFSINRSENNGFISIYVHQKVEYSKNKKILICYTPYSIIFICLFIILLCVSYPPYSISLQIVY